MSIAKEPFFFCVENTLRAALCILQFPSTFTDGEAMPEVELRDAPPTDGASSWTSSLSFSPHDFPSALYGNPLCLRWTQGDECCIETTHNSARVSFWFAAAHQPSDPLTSSLLLRYVAFLCTHGAATARLPVLRCAPIPRRKAVAATPSSGRHESGGCYSFYDVSFLVLPQHVEKYGREEVVAFIVSFARNVEADVAGLKVSLNARCRAAAHAFFS